MNKFTTVLIASAFHIGMAADFVVTPSGSLEAARDAARKAGAGPHRIILQSGDYFVAKTLELDARDSNLTIEAAETGKVTIYGGKLVTGWRRDGEKFWCADVPANWDFRALVVNGRMPERARLPEEGTFKHKSQFDVRWLSSVGGGWERKPTEEELTTMLYDPKDIPAAFECKNAEVRVYHMWDESLVGVVRNDTNRHALIFAPPAKSPPGAFGVKKYVIFNIREGMTKPGQWYLDRAAGKLVYWPLPDEDMTKAKVVAPVLEKIIQITGATNITLRGFSLQATTTPLKPGGFGAYAFDGALDVTQARQCVFEKLDISNVGGQGIVMRQVEDCRVSDCQIHNTGACGIKADGSDTLIARNHIHHVGRYHPSAVALSATHAMKPGSERGFHLYRNEIHDTPYSGIIGSGGGHLIEENLISRVMREMHDGGAIYGGMRNSILRGNVVRDVVKIGEGYGVSAYYLDEGARDCVVERNVSIGVERPTHNHIAADLVIRDNVFLAETNMVLSFPRSSGCIFQGNTLFAPGKITLTQPNAVKLWTNNVVFCDGVNKPFTIADALAPTPPPARRTAPVSVARIAQPPTLDGEIGWNEWPNTSVSLDRTPSRWSASGAPAFAKLAYDDQCLYVAVNVAMFDVSRLRKGAKWGKHDGAEVCIAGKEGAFVIHGFANGVFESVTLAGVPADAAARVGKAVRFAAKTYGTTRGGWRCEWAIPWEALGIKPSPGLKVPFNIGVRRMEDGIWRCLEGTLAQNWRLDQAAVLQLK